MATTRNSIQATSGARWRDPSRHRARLVPAVDVPFAAGAATKLRTAASIRRPLSSHRLRRSDRKRLALLAEYHDLPLAPVIFVRPDLFAAAQIPDGGELQLAAYERLKNKLFAGLERDVAATSAASQISAAAAGPVVAPSVVASSVEITSDASTSTPVQ